ncbi:hypothetical protein C7B67_09015 [filamentous cyanobacterium Phorm 6]|nr:hypothetical protein C7B67_09015 [filamentous cyanobacterium Phorm 6]
MTSMNVLRQEAAAIGITDAEARKYGDLRHKRTWSLAIEHHLSMQDFAVGVAPVGAGFAIGQPNNSDRRSHQNRGFKQVVQNHIKALTIASTSRTIQINSQVSNWVCPECYPEVESGCHLCAGEGYISDIAAIGWTLAYMEMLGCSAREIEPLRNFSSSFNILEINLKICVAVKKSTEVLARTEKLVIGNW